MAAGYLYGWDATNEKWVKIYVNTSGKPVIVTS